MNKIFTGFAIWMCFYVSVSLNSGCAQIGAPTGGAKDTLAPVLVKATPELISLNFKGNKITLVFDEYVELNDIQNNVLISPVQKNNPSIGSSLKTVTVKLKDSLLPQTTYSIQFGNAIRDINEGNKLPNFTYVFSTGNTIDSFSLSGKLLLAETGLADSTIAVLLYLNTNDSMVQTHKPDYIARPKGDGSFTFRYLPSGTFNVYALKDADGNKYYSIKTEYFAFLNSPVTVSDQTADVSLFAYAEEKPRDNKISRVLKPALEKKLKYSPNLSGSQDLLSNLELNFNNPLKETDTNLMVLTDTNYIKIKDGNWQIDSTRKVISFTPVWIPGKDYRLIIPATLEDSAGNTLAKTDTLSFSAKKEADYARVVLRFTNFDKSKNPVLQFISNQTVKFTYPLEGAEWRNTRFPPGDYEIRIFNDDNRDSLWTPGNYEKKLQPEKAFTLPQKLSIRADWDNERDISL